MDTPTQVFLFTIGILTVLAFAAINFYKWWIRRKHTRERFAFFTVRIFVTFMVTSITLLLVRNQVIEVLIGSLNAFFGYDIPNAEPGSILIASIFILLCAGLLFLLITTMHHNWNGLPSTRQVNFKDTGRKISIWKDHQFYWKHSDDIEVYEDEGKAIREVFSPYEADTRSWHTKAANLFSLLDQQYIIKPEEWYGEYHCYLSHYGQDQEKLGILCLDKPLTQNEIDTFLTLIKNKGNDFHKLIVAISGEGQRTSQVIDGYTVEFRYESELLDNLIPLVKYKNFIDDYFNQHTLENSSLKLSDMYVPLGGHSVIAEKQKLKKDESLTSVEEHILNWAKSRQNNSTEHLAILGDYGQGKTVLMHKLVKEMLEKPAVYNRIPILLELRGLSPRNSHNIADILSQWANRFQAKAEALEELHRAGKLFIILDGFDEMDLVGDTHLLFEHFSQLWTLARVPNSMIVIAGRPNLFADDEERRMALGIQEPRIHLPYAKAIYLDKLSNLQIEHVLRNVQPQTKEGILQALGNTKGNGSFAELISRPSTLYQLSTVWDKELAKQKDQLHSATVIGSFLKKAYDRQEKKAATVLTSSERHYFMMGIAVGMMLDHSYTNQIKHKDLEIWVKKLWENFPPKLAPYEDTMQGNKVFKPLPERLKETPNPLETIIKDVRVGGILVQDISGRDVFKFAHKSYLEYLVSAFFSGFALQNEYDRNLLMMVNAIAKTTGFSQEKLKTSPDVERFTAELVAASIELLDEQGNPLPINENQKKYSKALYHMLILKTYPFRGRFFPNLTGWLSMHPDQNQFFAIGILSILLLIGFFFVPEGKWQNAIVIANTILCLWWAGLLLKYRFKKGSLERIKVSDFLAKARLYQNASTLINCPMIHLSDSLGLVIHHTHKEKAYKAFVLVMLPICLAFAGAFAGAFAFGTAFGTAFGAAIGAAIAIGAAGAILSASVGGAVASVLGVGVGAVAGAFAFAGVVGDVSIVVIEFIMGAGVVSAGKGILLFVRLPKYYREAFTALTDNPEKKEA